MNHIKKLVYGALCLALALYLPFMTAQNYILGQTLCLMHIPALLCGFICGWHYGAIVGFIAPLLRYSIFAAPPMPTALTMAFELAAYGCLAAVFYKAFPKKTAYIYASLVLAMLGGRIVLCVASIAAYGVFNTPFTFTAFLNGAFVTALPGIVLHILIIPPIVYALKKARFI
ncbi:MAG: ECF transporter S component [Clostridia bacterium]|nr:ECF transporter S component [Clostridia bacterium]